MNVMQNSHLPPRINRRELLARGAHAFGAVALWHLLNQDSSVARETNTHFAARAKNVIFIFMAGGPSHLDLYDPKPKMTELHGQPVPESLLASLADPVIKSSARVMASPRTFQRYGESGIEFSDYIPHTGRVADDICLIRSMYTDQSNHDPAQLLLNCGLATPPERFQLWTCQPPAPSPPRLSHPTQADVLAASALLA